MKIKQKQWQLHYLGYYSGSIDGIWGPLSVEATRHFQTENELTSDGIFGRNSIEKSKTIILKIQKAITTGNIAIDGLAGTETKTATLEWQISHGLTGTGIADASTREKIFSTEPVIHDRWEDIKYFSKQEFKCKCGGRYCSGFPAEMDYQLMDIADDVRSYFNAPAFISSGLRCTNHNSNVGGVSGSRHMLGKAIDFRIEGISAKKLYNYVKYLSGIRYCYIIDSSYVHMDVA